jgi:arylsulfatase
MLALMTAGAAAAQQFDAPYRTLQERNEAQWSAEDKQISDKLSALESKFGKKPNIIFILTDDVGFGELGWQGGGKHRGTPSAELDRMAYEGMRFWSAYSEPSCTPSRIAINTGRHPVRTGLLSVLWPGNTEGLSGDEVTIAEVLSQAGYDTAMWGKWHMGDLPEHAPENQGYDYAYYGLFNGAADGWPGAEEFYATNMPQPTTPAWYDFPGKEEYKKVTGIDVTIAGYVGRKGEGRKPIDGPAGLLGTERQELFEKESIAQMTDYIRDRADSDKPFFIYWPSYAQQVHGSKEYANSPGVDPVNAQASFMAMHNAHVRQLLDTLEETGIAENTLVVWWSDNGPMYGFWPHAGYSWLQGAKGDTLEGGVRVPAMAWWPGMIEPNQDPVDFIHLTDMFTTAARIGGAMEFIPDDRITDGVDQTALLLLGEGHSRRDYMFHYSGGTLGAVRWRDIKATIRGGGSTGGLPALEMTNVRRDPGEKFAKMYPYLWTVAPLQNLVASHKRLIEKFPNRKPGLPDEAQLTPHD